ncbi:TIGR01440 family protein [Paenibacillus gorillae]|uniref:TIGR01440 family protein n=1 Tax=Paenibacillus gorillae TaxID=1243662 RepID=UPI0004BCABC3|nr:TIGR01440 family protein [Paenibacillus gorillae]
MSGNDEITNITSHVEQIIRELAEAGSLAAGQLLVIGTSTSEVLGHRIGTSGTVETAAQIFAGVEAARRDIGFYPVFQCCEHLNRALVIEREAAEKYGLEEVAAVPVPKAGGSMAAYAYRQLTGACLVETIAAHAGIDIGDTFIGMHLRRVAVPVRPSIKNIGSAHVTMAYARPKLIGGARAVYTAEPEGSGLAVEQSPGTCD